MPHIHTKPGQYDHTVSAYIVRTDVKGGPKIMLHRHKKLNRYMQFGGHVELDENPWQAIIHELREESGYSINQLKILQPQNRLTYLSGNVLPHPYPVSYLSYQYDPIDNHNHTDSAFAFVTDQEPKFKVKNGESSDIILVTRDELLKLPKPEVYDSIVDVSLFIFDVCLDKWERVPTAFG